MHIGMVQCALMMNGLTFAVWGAYMQVLRQSRRRGSFDGHALAGFIIAALLFCGSLQIWATPWMFTPKEEWWPIVAVYVCFSGCLLGLHILWIRLAKEHGLIGGKDDG